ncbi:MAG: SPOR domain-containing protein, partial [Pseudomonadota bacterium]
ATTASTATTTSATTLTSATTATTLPPAPVPAPAKAPAPAQAAAEAEPETYSLHAGLFVGPIQSGRLAEQLAAAGFAAWVREERRADGQVRYRVYVGPFADKDQVQAVLAAVTAKFGIKPFVVNSPAP